MSIHHIGEFLLLTSCTLFVTTVGFAIAWIRARERTLQVQIDRWRPVAGPPDVAHEKLERAVDAIALEVERISEGQRFVTKLLAERGDAARQASARLEPPRVVTPH